MLLFAVIDGAPPKHRFIQLDETLIHRIGADDMAAFQQFYEHTHQALFAFILSLVRDTHDAEDVLQDTYLKIRASAHLYEARGKPMAWVFTVARNLALMHLRRQNRIADFSGDDLENDSLLSTRIDVDDRLVLETLLNEMDEAERSIILLHAVSGYKHAELARDLSMPLATVLSKYHRGLKKLRTRLAQQKGGRR